VVRKICVVTGSRAEYGLLSGLMKVIKEDKDLQLQVIATNMHLSPEFGLTYREIENDGFHIDRKVEMLLSSDTANGTTKSVGLGTIGFADAFEDLHPDIIVILGDRYEMFSVVSAATLYRIPIAHLHGGEITEGAYDNGIRHAITKLSHLHFTSTEEYRHRIIQMGEQPQYVYNVGALGIENIKKVQPMTKAELEQSLGFDMGDKCLLVTYHPVTLENHTAANQINNILRALDLFKDYKIIFTYPNSDTDGRIIIERINAYVEAHKDRTTALPSLGLKRYLSALRYVKTAIGNSSSGIIEVPSFGISTLNIGDRQKGRLAAASVINCGTSVADITEGLDKALNLDCSNISNPYEGKNTTTDILKVLKEADLDKIIRKRFYDIKF
jgi:UDP-N-acetylglucosamine 2-epimerase (non-hydrolysing)/GDP/UDP-N,N'-diacetylbacillosamine 2-epimerase (hydrolysing)